MECHEVQELILESFEGTASRERRHRIETHVSTCPECARFALVQQALDDRLGALLLPAPTTSVASRAALRARLRDEAAPPTGRADVLPEIVHFGSFAIATLVMAAVLPLSPSIVATIGVALALVSHVLLSAIRDSVDDYVLGADV